MGPDAMILVFWVLSFKPTFSLSSFIFIKRLFSSFSLSAIRVVSSAYLRLLIFLPAILIPAYASSSPAFLMMYSAYKLNKQGDNIQPRCIAFPIWSQSVVLRPVLTIASWPAYRFLKRQVRWSGFIGRTDPKAEAPILWPPDVKNWLVGKDPDAGKDWGQEKWVTEDEVVGWHHWFNVHEFEQTPGDSEG